MEVALSGVGLRCVSFWGPSMQRPPPPSPPSECDPQCLQQVPDLLRYHTFVFSGCIQPSMNQLSTTPS